MTDHRVVQLRRGGDPVPAPPPEPPRTALEAVRVGVRHRADWVLRECSLALPAGRIAALVGPNGAGKTTLLQLPLGLRPPDEGQLLVFGAPVGQFPAALSQVGYLSQHKPLYDGFTVAEMLRFGRALNPAWDGELAARRLRELDIPPNRQVSTLSGGQQTQVALTLAIAKRPRLLVLDEPLAELDPLARHDVTASLMAAVAETGMTVFLSSQVVADIHGICDWLVVLNRGSVQVSGDIEGLLADHRLLIGLAEKAEALAGRLPVVARSSTGRQASLLVRGGAPVLDPAWTEQPVDLESLVLTYLRDPSAVSLPRPGLTVTTTESSP